MPVTVRPAGHPPRECKPHPAVITTAEALLEGSCHNEHVRCKEVIQSSFSNGQFSAADRQRPKHILPSSNAFVSAVQNAYSQHHHLVIRPEDVWFAVLTQFGFYVNGNAEQLRHHFVTHEGQQELAVVEYGTVATVDFGDLATRMTDEMSKNMTDPSLRDWVLPGFTTTTQTDTVTAAVLMMGTMQKYFSYSVTLLCGIPSVTLLGMKEDWEDIRGRLDKLRDFGDEAATFARLLVPVLDHLVRSFDAPEDAGVLDFWSRIVHRESGGSGPTYLSGWITAFCYWDVNGRAMYKVRETAPESSTNGPRAIGAAGGCIIDGVQYGVIDTDSIPEGFVGVPLKVDDNGHMMETRLVAGSVGIEALSSGDSLDRSHDHTHWQSNLFAQTKEGQKRLVDFVPQVDERATGLDTLRCVTGWWLYEIGEVETKKSTTWTFSGNDREIADQVEGA